MNWYSVVFKTEKGHRTMRVQGFKEALAQAKHRCDAKPEIYDDEGRLWDAPRGKWVATSFGPRIKKESSNGSL